MSETPDTLQVSASERLEVEASHADLLFTCKGSSLITGQAALTQAREVQRLVGDLKAAGIAEDDIELRNVKAEVSSGIFSKSSSASYSLRARCRQLEQLGDVLAAATEQKNVTLERLEWRYPEGSEAEVAALERCYQAASAKARRLAAALGVELGAVFSARDTVVDSEAAYQGQVDIQLGLYRARATSDSGLEMRHRKEMTYSVTVLYRLV